MYYLPHRLDKYFWVLGTNVNPIAGQVIWCETSFEKKNKMTFRLDRFFPLMSELRVPLSTPLTY